MINFGLASGEAFHWALLLLASATHFVPVTTTTDATENGRLIAVPRALSSRGHVVSHALQQPRLRAHAATPNASSE